jgi:type II secretory pathway component PulF
MHQELYTSELDAFIKAGFAAGSLGVMIAQAAVFYKEQFYQRISFCIALIQPVMLSVMGLLIAVLIIALYMPLFTISSMF